MAGNDIDWQTAGAIGIAVGSGVAGFVVYMVRTIAGADNGPTARRLERDVKELKSIVQDLEIKNVELRKDLEHLREQRT